MDVSISNIHQYLFNLDIPKRYQSGQHINSLTYRASRRIASRYEDRYRNDTMTGALGIYVMCYLYHCISMKYIVLDAREKSETINIHLSNTSFPVMSMWSYEELPLLVLAIFAQRYGVPFRFHHENLARNPVLSFRPSYDLLPIMCENYEYRNFPSRTLVCTAGYRDHAVLPPSETDVSFFWGRASYRGMERTDVGFRVDPRPFLSLTMAIDIERHDDHDIIRNPPELHAVIDRFFVPVMDAWLAEAHKLVEQADIHKIYICDHPFLDTWLLKDAVAARGGQVMLVPHGFNPAVMQLGASEDISRIIVSCWSAADLWTYHSRATIHVQSGQSRNRSLKSVGRYDPARQAAIHVFGCHEFSGYIPEFQPGTNPVGKYSGLMAGLTASEFPLYFRGRAPGVTWALLNSMNEKGRIRDGTLSPVDAEGPNMVFVFVGPATSGIYEAIGRGIPVIRVKAPDTAEYLFIDEEIVKVYPSVEAASQAIALAGGDGYDELVRRQWQWFIDETKDGEILSPDL